MFQKKMGKMCFSTWINSELQLTGSVSMIVCGIFCLAAFITVRVLSGPPYRMILNLGISNLMPPVWLMTVLRGFGFFCVGCAAGIVLGWRERGCDREKYRGCMMFVLLMLLELLWYPTIFRSALLFLAMIESVLILCISVIVTACFLRVSKLAAMIFVLHDIWLAYLLIFTCSIFFRT